MGQSAALADAAHHPLVRPEGEDVSKTPRFEIVRPRHFALFPWTWKLVSANGRVVAISWLRFKHAYLARRSATRVRNALYGRPVPIYPRRKPKPLRPGELQHLVRKMCKDNEQHVLPTLDAMIGLSHTLPVLGRQPVLIIEQVKGRKKTGKDKK